jgi:hypothetical protein
MENLSNFIFNLILMTIRKDPEALKKFSLWTDFSKMQLRNLWTFTYSESIKNPTKEKSSYSSNRNRFKHLATKFARKNCNDRENAIKT